MVLIYFTVEAWNRRKAQAVIYFVAEPWKHAEKLRLSRGKIGIYIHLVKVKNVFQYSTVIPRLMSDPANEFFG